jgi:hypothetical protein
MKYYGPSTKFESTPNFGRAVALCKLENIECRIDPHVNTIHFENAKAEERFTIAWSKAVAGSQRFATEGSRAQILEVSSD